MKSSRFTRMVRAANTALRLWQAGVISTDTFDSRWEKLYAAIINS